MKNYIKVGDTFTVITNKGAFKAEFIDFEVPTIKLETGEVISGTFKVWGGKFLQYKDENGETNNIQLVGNFKVYEIEYKDYIDDETGKLIDQMEETRFYLSKRIANQDYKGMRTFYSSLNDGLIYHFYSNKFDNIPGDKETGFCWTKTLNKVQRRSVHIHKNF